MSRTFRNDVVIYSFLCGRGAAKELKDLQVFLVFVLNAGKIVRILRTISALNLGVLSILT